MEATVRAPLDYLVCLHRAGRHGEYELWTRTVREPLPSIAVPLTGGLPDVAVNLQSLLDRFYDTGPYRRRIDYRAEPVPPLGPEDAAWADALLREKGLR